MLDLQPPGSAEPHDTDSVTWHMRYRVLDGDTLVSERVVDYRWWTISEARLRDELHSHGLTACRTCLPDAGLYTIDIDAS